MKTKAGVDLRELPFVCTETRRYISTAATRLDPIHLSVGPDGYVVLAYEKDIPNKITKIIYYRADLHQVALHLFTRREWWSLLINIIEWGQLALATPTLVEAA